MAIMWATELRLYHPWHANTLVNADEYKIQYELIDWRFKNLEYLAINGIDKNKNAKTFNESEFMDAFKKKQLKPQPQSKPSLIRRILNKLS